MDFSDQVSRLARAHQLGAALSADMQAWAASTPFGVRASIAEDRLSWELRLQVSQSPPLAEWGFRFGEAVNHLRAALDNLTVAIARQSGVTDEKQLKGLMFPICSTLKDWKGRQKALSCLPDWCREALEQVQPFQRPEHGGSLDEDLLLVLRELDNSTKHHLQVKPDVAPQSIRHTPTVEFETEVGTAASVVPDVEVVVGPFEHDTVLLRHRTKGRIKSVEGKYNITAQVQAVTPDGRSHGVTDLLAALWEYTRIVMGHMMGAAEEAKGRPGA
ncbi:hypothetical protein ACFV6M_06265 [Streptomyces californicus]|uniref:hypothetical protein n=1 Tax=Streptomyces TaxID=1883 RepID=UPI001180C0A5|nr:MULTISPECIES: hypothetical protein [Streptomyces]